MTQVLPKWVLGSTQRQTVAAGKDSQRQRQAEIEKEGGKQREGSSNFINAGTVRRASVALQSDETMRAVGRPSFLTTKDNGSVVAARTLAQGAGHKTQWHGRDDASCNARRVRCTLGK